MATAKKKAPAKQPKTNPSDPYNPKFTYNTTTGKIIVNYAGNQPPTPKPPPIKISTTPKPLSAKDAQANAKAIAKFNRGEARTAARLKEQLAPGRARAARANAGKPQPPQPRGGSGASRSFGGNMGGRGNMGGGLRKQGK